MGRRKRLAIVQKNNSIEDLVGNGEMNTLLLILTNQ
jgi:hypothetical protein